VYSVIDTSEHEIAPLPAGVNIREVMRLELSRRPGSRPTEYWSVGRILEVIEEEIVTGIGAPTELPCGLTE